MGATDEPLRGNMRVLMVSTSYPQDLRDWRGLFIRHLADAVGRREDLRLRLWAPPGETHPSVEVDVLTEERQWLSRLMAAGGIAHLYRSAGLRGGAEVLRLLVYLRRLYRRSHDIDVFHVNWLQNALPMPHDRRPLLVSVLGTDLQLLKLPLMKAMLRRVFRGRPTAICPNADWMLAPLREAFGDIAEVRFVPFGIDPGWFAVDRGRRVRPHRWLAVTRLTAAKLGPLFDSCAPLFQSGERELHLIGPMQEDIVVPQWVHYHGPLGPDVLRETWFPQATGLITLSRHAEGRPQVMLEAMASALPIVASDIAAHASFLRDGVTGMLVADGESPAEAIRVIEDDVSNQRIGSAARTWASKEVGTWDDCARRYADIYRRLMDKGAQP
ncbi:glycosyltransferase family 4 protein [Fontimonas sp. SYSU GA230001]|uniref:glycosyltransferase family 4 protein n=1 Tax=Fontimonas sp. SYSU GA230001 TaxID=3142450 RepID=UPI0032B447E9